ncbi:MAG: DUF3823 domain-containing protein [Prolixibacteraceae bacterium]
MRKIIIFAIIAFASFSCEVDNYGVPDAELYGTVLDAETNEAVPGDIVNGTVIQLIEHGWVTDQTNVTQTLVVQNDGNYRNSMIFPAKYKVTLANGNFIPVSPIDTFEIKGRTELNFKVTPYLRIRNAAITKGANKITATFKIEQKTTDPVVRIALFCHPNASVGSTVNIVKTETNLNSSTNPDTSYTLEIGLPNANLIGGRSYHFRIGALSSAPGARYNYSETVSIQM